MILNLGPDLEPLSRLASLDVALQNYCKIILTRFVTEIASEQAETRALTAAAPPPRALFSVRM